MSRDSSGAKWSFTVAQINRYDTIRQFHVTFEAKINISSLFANVSNIFKPVSIPKNGMVKWNVFDIVRYFNQRIALSHEPTRDVN